MCNSLWEEEQEEPEEPDEENEQGSGRDGRQERSSRNGSTSGRRTSLLIPDIRSSSTHSTALRLQSQGWA